MLLILKVILVYIALAAVLWGLSRYLQGILYTEVPGGLLWRAAAGAGIIWFVGLAWPLLINKAADVGWPVTFEEMFLFEGSTTPPVTFKELIVIDGDKQTRFARTPVGPGRFEYRDFDARTVPSNAMVLKAIPEDGEPQQFEVIKDKEGYIDRSNGGRARYKNEQGQIMTEEELGELPGSSSGGFIFSLFADVLIWAAWFLVLWLLMLFQWPHALGISIPAVLIWAVALNPLFTKPLAA